MFKYSQIESVFAQENLVVHEYNLETDEEIDLPYLVYATTSGDSFSADGITFYQTLIVSLAIIDETLSFPMQRQVESILTNSDTYFEKNINFDDGARLYSITYSFFVEDDAINQSSF